MVTNMYYFIIGLVLIFVGLILSILHPRKWRLISNGFYIFGMALILFAIFGLNDPIEGIPTEIWNILEYFVVAGSFFGFFYMLKRDVRAEFDARLTLLDSNINNRFSDLKTDLNDKINNLKNDMQRDLSRIETLVGKKR